MNLTQEEQEIVKRYRSLSESQKKAILASQNSFFDWIKRAIKWVWDRIVKLAIEDIIGELYRSLRSALFGF